MPETMAPADLTLLELESDFDERVLCESQYCTNQRRPPHAAEWFAEPTCGRHTAVCEFRRRRCYAVDGWWCTPGGCGHWHLYQHIDWTVIPPTH